MHRIRRTNSKAGIFTTVSVFWCFIDATIGDGKSACVKIYTKKLQCHFAEAVTTKQLFHIKDIHSERKWEI